MHHTGILVPFLMTAETPLINEKECPPLKCGGHCSPHYIFISRDISPIEVIVIVLSLRLPSIWTCLPANGAMVCGFPASV